MLERLPTVQRAKRETNCLNPINIAETRRDQTYMQGHSTQASEVNINTNERINRTPTEQIKRREPFECTAQLKCQGTASLGADISSLTTLEGCACMCMCVEEGGDVRENNSNNETKKKEKVSAGVVQLKPPEAPREPLSVSFWGSHRIRHEENLLFLSLPIREAPNNVKRQRVKRGRNTETTASKPQHVVCITSCRREHALPGLISASSQLMAVQDESDARCTHTGGFKRLPPSLQHTVHFSSIRLHRG
ncbi:hypothetical protein ABL78_8482, partial [Leptomonas seymouri]